jgi:hypothetical protein
MRHFRSVSSAISVVRGLRPWAGAEKPISCCTTATQRQRRRDIPPERGHSKDLAQLLSNNMSQRTVPTGWSAGLLQLNRQDAARFSSWRTGSGRLEHILYAVA